MPNWCETIYELRIKDNKISQEEGNKILESIYNDLAKAIGTWPEDMQARIDEYNSTVNESSEKKELCNLWSGDPHWLGNVFLHRGMSLKQVLEERMQCGPYSISPCRGTIIELDFCPDENLLIVVTETAWQPLMHFLAKYYNAYKAVINFDYFFGSESDKYYGASNDKMAEKILFSRNDIKVNISSIEEWL